MGKRQILDPNDPEGKSYIWVDDGQPDESGAPGQDPTGAGEPTPAPEPPPPGMPTPPPLPANPAGGPTSIIPMPPPDPSGVPRPDATGTAALSDFGPGKDMRFTQIAPSTDARTARLNDLVDQSAGTLTDSPADPRLAAQRGAVDQFAGRLSTAPDLTKAGLDKLASIREATAEDRQRGIQDIGRGAAAFGRIGSGVTTSQLGDLEALLQKRQTAAETGLAGDLALQEAGDRRANLSAVAGLEGQTFGEGQQVGASNRANAATLASLQDQLFGQGTQQRNELRTERGYQADTANQATDREIQLQQLLDSLKNSQFGRDATAAELKLKGAGVADTQAAGASGAASDLTNLLAYFRAQSQRNPAAGYTAI